MPKNLDLQKELLAKVKPGTKPSHLKRSKSLGDISSPPLPLPSASSIQALETQISTLELKLATSEKEKNKLEVDNQQLKAALQEIDYQTQARKSASLSLLPTTPPPPSELSELDQALIARHQNLKDFFIQFSQAQNLAQELEENIDYASEELTRQDEEISKLKRESLKLKSTN